MSNEVFLTVKEASQYADVSEHTVRRILRLIRAEPEKVYNQLPVATRASIATSPYQLESKAIKIDRLGKHTNSPLAYRVARSFLEGFFNVDDRAIIMTGKKQGSNNPEYQAVPTMQIQGRDGLETIPVEGHKKRGRKKVVHHNAASPLIDDESLIDLVTSMKRQLLAQEHQIKTLTEQNKDLIAIMKKLLVEKGQ